MSSNSGLMENYHQTYSRQLFNVCVGISLFLSTLSWVCKCQALKATTDFNRPVHLVTVFPCNSLPSSTSSPLGLSRLCSRSALGYVAIFWLRVLEAKMTNHILHCISKNVANSASKAILLPFGTYETACIFNTFDSQQLIENPRQTGILSRKGCFS